MQIRRTFLAFASLAALLFAGPLAAHEAPEHDVHKIAIQVSDNDKGTMNKVLNVVANLARGFGERGELYEIEIVTFNAGLHMLRTDTSPVAERIQNFPTSIPNLTFSACGNTVKGMTKKEGTAPPIVDFANHVPAGVIRLMELSDQGYFVIRP